MKLASTHLSDQQRAEHADADSEPCALLGAEWESGPIILLIRAGLAIFGRTWVCNETTRTSTTGRCDALRKRARTASGVRLDSDGTVAVGREQEGHAV